MIRVNKPRTARLVATAAVATALLSGCTVFERSTTHACASWVGYGGDPQKMAGDAALVIDATITGAGVGGHRVQHYNVRVSAVAKGDAVDAGDRLRIFVPVDECADGAPSEMRGLHPGERVIAYLFHGTQFVFTPSPAWHALTPYDGITEYSTDDWQSIQQGG